MIRLARTLIFPALALLFVSTARADDPWVVYQGGEGPGQGKNVVLISGDEEYRSEEALPQLAKILAKHHGFTCTVLFAIGKDGTIDPNRNDNIPGLEALRKADLMIIATRFRDLPDDQMKEIVDYVESGRPIIGMRTATHAFNIKGSKKYARYSWNSKEWDGGFGRQVLGETWISHHGNHGKKARAGSSRRARRATRSSEGSRTATSGARPTSTESGSPCRATASRWSSARSSTDMTPTGKPVEGKKNDPMMPVAWVKTFTGESGKPARVFTTTMGAATDLESAGVRRMLVNAVYWTRRPGRQDLARERRQPRRRVQAPPVRLQRCRQGRQARGPRGARISRRSADGAPAHRLLPEEPAPSRDPWIAMPGVPVIAPIRLLDQTTTFPHCSTPVQDETMTPPVSHERDRAGRTRRSVFFTLSCYPSPSDRASTGRRARPRQ